MLTGVAVEQCGIYHQVQELGDKYFQHAFHVRLHNEVVVQWLGLFFVTLAVALAPFAQILLSLQCRDVRSQVALVILIQCLADVYRQQGLAGEDLRTGTLEVMVNQFHTVQFAVKELVTQLTRQINTLLHIGLVGQ